VGNYDSLKFPYKEIGVDYLAFTDNVNIKSNGWELIQIDFNFDNSTKSNRFIKMLPDLFLCNYEKSLYIDGNIQLIGPLFKLFNSVTDYPIYFMTVPVHPVRTKLYDEFMNCIQTGKVGEAVALSLYFKITEKFPNINEHRLTENSIIFRYHNDLRSKSVGLKWFENFDNLILRDQLLLDYTLLSLNLNIFKFDKNFRGFNSYLFYSVHNSEYLALSHLIKINMIKFVNKILSIVHFFK
jgi:hypothetical protein